MGKSILELHAEAKRKKIAYIIKRGKIRGMKVERKTR